MSLDPSINLSVDVLDEGAPAAELIAIEWLRPLLPIGQIANTREPGAALPFILVNYIDGVESVEESYADDVVSLHCLYAKGLGAANKKAANDFADIVHRRMLLLARYLEPVVVGDRPADIDYVEVFSPMRWEAYGDDQILRKVGRYRMGLAYAKLS